MGQPANLMGIANAFQQGRDRLFQDRMAEVWGQFGEWNQDEPAKMQARACLSPNSKSSQRKDRTIAILHSAELLLAHFLELP